VLVGISELEVSAAPGRLGALGLGSCVAIILYDPVAKIGGLAHVLLPAPGVGRKNQDSPGRYAPIAVDTLVIRMKAMGAAASRVSARLVGGASMFAGLQPPGTIQMGERNVHAAREALRQRGIRVDGEMVGGDYGRSVELDLATGKVVVTSYLHGSAEL
jgi:chemotaxis protein CheD